MALTLATILTMTWALPAARADETDAPAPIVAEVTMDSGDAPAPETALASESEAPAGEDASAPATEDAAASQPFVVPESDESAQASEPAIALETVAQPELTTDKLDYAPGERVSIFGRFFSALADIVLTVFGDSETGSHYFESTSILKADDLGSFATSLLLDNMYRPFYTMVAKSLAGDILATSTFTDAPGAAGDLDQCSNGSSASPNTCTGTAWQNGNLNSNQAHYVEGDSAPYRIRLTGLPTSGTNTLVIEYDIKHSSKHAIDFLTSFDRTETTANPCSGVSPCSLSGTAAIPAPTSVGSPVSGQPTAAFNALPSSERRMSVYNGTIGAISYVSQGDLNAAQSATRVKIEFTASNSTVVFAWGGHIGSSLDWGAGQSAGGISGSPYHMRFIELNGKGGNQDRSLSAGAIAPPAPKGALSGVKFNDLNGNGAKDPSDISLSGWTINLTGTATATAVTDANGNYAFADLADGTYTVCEVMQSGWTQTYPSSGASCPGGTRGHALVISGGAILSGNDFGNAQLGSITIDKVTNPSGDAQSFSFALTGASSGNASLADASAPATFANRPLGSYTITETSVSGWTLSGVSCTGVTTTPVSGGVTFTLGAGQNPVCTFTNTKDAKLTVTKVVTNDDGGTKTVSDFPLFVDGNSVTSGAKNVFAAGAHAVSETQQSGYAMTSISGDCDAQGNVTLSPGDDKTCVITNNDIRPKLTLTKIVVNDDGGTKVVSDFALDVSGTPVLSGAQNGFAAGSYQASETNLAGYAASSWSGDCAADGSVTLAVGDVKSCSITNNDIAPTLTLVKTVINNDGGSLTVAQVPLFIDGNAATSGVAATLSAGDHSASETNQPGYTASAWGGDCAADGSVSLAPGENKTCTIVNDDIAPKLTLIKIVSNDDGGTLEVEDVALFVDGNSVTSGVASTLTAGNHAASETNVPGYAASSWSGDCAADGSISLNPGDDKTCTITNDDIAPLLTLVKHVVNDDGGTLEVEDVALFVDGDAVTSGLASALTAGAHVASETNVPGYAASAWGGDCDAQGNVTLNPGDVKICTITNDDIAPKLTLVKTVINNDGGTLEVEDVPLFIDGNAATSGVAATLSAGDHSASETNPAGYTASAWGGDCAADGSVSLNPGDDKTCTITNDDIAPKLTLVKHVVNDDGGTLEVEDVALFVDGNSVTSGVASTLTAGSHAASETNVPGYAASSWSGDCAADGSISLNPGDDKTCVITNDDIAPTLTLVKTVINDDGGTLTVAQVPLFIDGNAATSGVAATLSAGNHTASETNPAGYTASAWGGDCAADGSVSLAPGENKTCTITNDDIRPKLTLVKTVINDDGGSLQVGDVALFVDGNAVTSGSASTLSAGNHAASETNPVGYLASQWGGDCAADGSIVLNPGDDKSCTIVNDDIAPRLTLVKQVVNDDGGTLAAEDVALFVDGNSVTTGVPSIQLSGAHTASETEVAGYAASSWSGDCAADGSITLNPGDDKTCVITNNDIRPKLTLTKIVVNDDGGTMTVSDFALDVSGTPVLSGAQNGFAAGSYQASETNLAGYAASSWSGDCAADGSVTLAVGDVKTCSITNDDIPGEIRGMKFEDKNGNGVKDAGEPGLANWTINLSNGATTTTGANGAYAFTGLDAGSYTVTETQQSGWTQTTANPSAISLGLAQVVTGVDFGNFRLGRVTGIKWHDADMSGLKDNGETNLAGWTIYVDANGNGALDLGELSAVTTLSGYTLTGLAAGTYSICEVGQAGWSQVYPANGACHSVTISTSGQTAAGIDFGNVNEREGTIGLWRNWNKHNKYSQAQIDGWLAAIDASSAWLMAEAGYPATTTGMVNLINDATKYCSQFPDKIDCAKRKFLAQYMVNRLNVASGRKSLTSTYDLSSFGGAMGYLGISPSTNVSLSAYFAKVELKAAASPNRNQFMQMMSVSDYINNLGL